MTEFHFLLPDQGLEMLEHFHSLVLTFTLSSCKTNNHTHSIYVAIFYTSHYFLLSSHFYERSLSLPLIIFDGVTVASHPINGMCTYTWKYPETWRKSVKEAVGQTFLPRSTFVLTGLPVQFGSLCGKRNFLQVPTIADDHPKR